MTCSSDKDQHFSPRRVRPAALPPLAGVRLGVACHHRPAVWSGRDRRCCQRQCWKRPLSRPRAARRKIPAACSLRTSHGHAMQAAGAQDALARSLARRRRSRMPDVPVDDLPGLTFCLFRVCRKAVLVLSWELDGSWMRARKGAGHHREGQTRDARRSP